MIGRSGSFGTTLAGFSERPGIEHLAKSIPRLIKEEALLEPDYRKRTELDRWAFKSEFIRRLKAMIEMARSDPKIQVGFAELDADPLMLGVLNGVVDLKSGELLPPDRSYYITKQAHVVFDKDGLCPKWLAFIDKVTGGDKEFARYLQRWMGYCLTGSTSEQCLIMLYGTGANGKSVFLRVLEALMGGYAKSTNAETLMAKSSQSGVPRLTSPTFKEHEL